MKRVILASTERFKGRQTLRNIEMISMDNPEMLPYYKFGKLANMWKNLSDDEIKQLNQLANTVGEIEDAWEDKSNVEEKEEQEMMLAHAVYEIVDYIDDLANQFGL